MAATVTVPTDRKTAVEVTTINNDGQHMETTTDRVEPKSRLAIEMTPTSYLRIKEVPVEPI